MGGIVHLPPLPQRVLLRVPLGPTVEKDVKALPHRSVSQGGLPTGALAGGGSPTVAFGGGGSPTVAFGGGGGMREVDSRRQSCLRSGHLRARTAGLSSQRWSGEVKSPAVYSPHSLPRVTLTPQ